MGLTAFSRIQGKAWRCWNCPDLRKLVGQVTLVTFLWKVHDQWWLISWIGATFTLLSLIICAFCDFFLSACLINWIGSFNSLKPDHFISPFPHENNLRVKKQFGNSLQFSRLLDYRPSRLLSKLSLHSQRNKPSETLYKVINWKVYTKIWLTD